MLDLRLADGRDLRYCLRNLHIRLKVDLHHRNAIQRGRFDMVDVVDRRRQRPLSDGHNAVGHLFRREPRILPDDGNHGDIDIRKNIHGHAQNRNRPKNQQQQCEYSKGIGPAQRKANNPHNGLRLPSRQQDILVLIRRLPARRLWFRREANPTE